MICLVSLPILALNFAGVDARYKSRCLESVTAVGFYQAVVVGPNAIFSAAVLKRQWSNKLFSSPHATTAPLQKQVRLSEDPLDTTEGRIALVNTTPSNPTKSCKFPN